MGWRRVAVGGASDDERLLDHAVLVFALESEDAPPISVLALLVEIHRTIPWIDMGEPAGIAVGVTSNHVRRRNLLGLDMIAVHEKRNALARKDYIASALDGEAVREIIGQIFNVVAIVSLRTPI